LRLHCCTNGISCKSNHIACLVKGLKKVVNWHMNDYRRQYVSRAFTTNGHAEVLCLKDIPQKRLKKLNVLILRFKKDGNLCDSRPCANCKDFLRKKGVTSVYCSMFDGSIQKIALDNVPDYLSSSQIQFKIFGLKPLSGKHIYELSKIGLDIDTLQKMSFHKQLDILTVIKKG